MTRDPRGAGERAARVLLVDGEPDHAPRMALLRDEGFAVEAPSDPQYVAQQALTSLARGGFDVALVRPSFIEAHGCQVRSFVAASDAMVVLLDDRAAGSVDEIEGVFERLIEPIDPALLRLALRRAVEHKRRCDERRRLDGELRREAADLEARAAEQTALVAELDKREASREKLRQFVVHDLKNQISVVKSNVAFVLEEVAGRPGDGELAAAERAIDRVLALTLGLVEIGPTIVAERRPEETAPLLAQVAAEQAVLAREAGVTVEVIGTPPAAMEADRGLVERVLVNLVENAVSHARARRVTLSATAGDDPRRVVFSVEDDGVGMPAGRPLGEPRTGLGLRFCRAAVDAHGGRLWIEERAPRGTAVRFVV